MNAGWCVPHTTSKPRSKQEEPVFLWTAMKNRSRWEEPDGWWGRVLLLNEVQMCRGAYSCFHLSLEQICQTDPPSGSLIPNKTVCFKRTGLHWTDPRLPDSWNRLQTRVSLKKRIVKFVFCQTKIHNPPPWRMLHASLCGAVFGLRGSEHPTQPG